MAYKVTKKKPSFRDLVALREKMGEIGVLPLATGCVTLDYLLIKGVTTLDIALFSSNALFAICLLLCIQLRMLARISIPTMFHVRATLICSCLSINGVATLETVRK